jgi:hypothetical protein
MAMIEITGNTYPVREHLRALGGKWNPARKCWMVPETQAEQAKELVSGGASSAPSASSAVARAPRDGEDSVVYARAVYRGRPCYVAGRRAGDWETRAVTTRDGAKMLLYSRDGSSQWWAPEPEVSIEKVYTGRPKTIAGLRRFAEQIRANGGTHPDACSYCGQLDCPAAYGRGGLCQED